MKTFDDNEYTRWMNQADHTYQSAINDKNNNDFNWSCFKSQQAAEFAIKALLYGLGHTPFGHSLIRLLNEVQNMGTDPSSILSCARILDRHYVPARYPNSYSTGSPFEYYDKAAADEALQCAKKIIDFIQTQKGNS
ncbi:MAG: HEPN domain-containing protein [Promethearchaeota archaeon]